MDSSGRLLTAALIALWSAKLLMERIPASRFPARAMILSDVGHALAQGGLLLWMLFTPEYWPFAFVVSSFCYGLSTPWFGPHRFSLLSVILTEEERHKAKPARWLAQPWLLGGVFRLSCLSTSSRSSFRSR
ncbi:hypothetical protein [Corynebacterium gerontici]|uniref:hypothetical protein n=1 Tax=Corynebacterium gerontici TaxID=2079234 RepID=UPI000F504CDD|nr:hypothetical protein [Corynebacterium gerontici]